MKPGMYQLVGTALCGALLLSVAGFAGYSVAATPTWFGPASTATPLSAGDDPVINGLRIVETPKLRRSPTRITVAEQPGVILLDDWTFTAKPKPSPFK